MVSLVVWLVVAFIALLAVEVSTTLRSEVAWLAGPAVHDALGLVTCRTGTALGAASLVADQSSRTVSADTAAVSTGIRTRAADIAGGEVGSCASRTLTAVATAGGIADESSLAPLTLLQTRLVGKQTSRAGSAGRAGVVGGNLSYRTRRAVIHSVTEAEAVAVWQVSAVAAVHTAAVVQTWRSVGLNSAANVRSYVTEP